MSVEAIKKAMEGVTPDRLRYEADAMFAAVQGEEYGDTFHAYNWADKPHRVLYDAIDLIRNSASTLESLQRENEELREDRDRTARNRDMYKGQVERQADNLSWYRSGSFAHAVNEHLSSAGISVNGDILHDCIRRTALASTGGEHHGN